MRRLLLITLCVIYGITGFSQTCPQYAVSIADVKGNVTNDFYSLGEPSGQGTVFAEGPSGPYTRVVWDLGSYVDSGTTICFRVRVNSCSGTSSTNANYSIWLAPDGVTPYNSPYTLQGTVNTSSSTWTTVCVNTVIACRYFKISDGGECSFEVDNISYNGDCGINTIDGHVWEDINYDQSIGGTESMAANKKVYLYRDLDKDAVIDVNEEIAIDSTSTNSSGFYSFSRPFDDSLNYVIRKIQSSVDDADEISGAANILNSYADFSTENSGFRFTNISVPKNAIIQKAYINFTASTTNSSNTYCTIKGHDAGNSNVFSSILSGVSGRALTSDSVSWAVPGITQYNSFSTADVSNIVQEIVDRSDWSSGNALSLLFFGNGGSSKAAYMFDANSTYAPTLVITYVDSTDEYYNVATNLNSYPESTVMSTDNNESAGFDRAGNEDSNNDFGYTPPNEISGKVFYDKGRNGTKAGNIGQPDVMVYLLENVNPTKLSNNVNDSINIGLDTEYELRDKWEFEIKNFGNSPINWTVTLADANYYLDSANIENSSEFYFSRTDHGDGTYTYVFTGKDQLGDGDETSTYKWLGSNFASDMNSDGFELEGMVALDETFANGIVTTAVTDANGDYTLYAPYMGGIDTFYITTDQPSYGDQIDLTTSNLQTAIFSEGGNLDPNNDYGFNGTLKITGFVFNDANADGVRQKSEFGERNVDVYLYEDTNNNDTLDAGETTVLETARTNKRGKYRFKDYFYGDSMSYIVTSELNDYPNNASTTTDNTEEATFITFNTVDKQNNFGFVEPNTISGKVFYDKNGNGLKSGSESGTPGITVYLYDDANDNGILEVSEMIAIDSAVTSGSGSYSFMTEYIGGTMSYIVNIDTTDLPTNSSLTTDNIEVASFTSGGNSDPNNNFGHIVYTVNITGRVWFDEDGNQSIGTSEFGQISSKVYLIDDANGDGLRTSGESVLDSANTEFGGYYGFTRDYVSGTYNYVLVTDTLTYPVGAAQSTDNIETASFSGPNQTDANNNFGFGINNCSGAADNVVENTTGESPFNVIGASDGNTLTLDNGEYVTFDMVDTLNTNKQFDLEWQGGSTGTNTVKVYQSVDLVNWTGPITITESGTSMNSSTITLTDSARFIRIESANASAVELDGLDYDCSVAPVPVEFIGVKAELINKDDVLVSWSTATEINNDYFEIQRRYEYETEFKTVGTHKGAGNSNQTLDYSFIDNSNRWLSPVLYYRIKQVDFDGGYDYSYVVVVSKQEELEVLMYPNPAQSETTVAVLTEEKNTTLRVMDMLGNDITGEVSLSEENSIYTLDVSGLRIGTYLIQVQTKTQSVTERLFIAY